MPRRERYIVGPTDECAEERGNLKRRLLELRDQTREEMQRIDTQFWKSWKKSQKPGVWVDAHGHRWEIDPSLTARQDGVGPDLSAHQEKMRRYDELLSQIDRMPCKEVRRLGRKLGLRKKTRSRAPKSGKRQTDAQEQFGAVPAASGVVVLAEEGATALGKVLDHASWAVTDQSRQWWRKGGPSKATREHLKKLASRLAKWAKHSDALRKAIKKVGGPLAALNLAVAYQQQYEKSEAKTAFGKGISAVWATTWGYGLGVYFPIVSAVDGLAQTTTGYSAGQAINQGIDQAVVISEGMGISLADGMFNLIHGTGQGADPGTAQQKHRSGANGPLFHAASSRGGYWVEYGTTGAVY